MTMGILPQPIKKKKGQRSVIQLGVNEVQNWTETNLAQLNEDKCKELRIDFSRNSNTSNTRLPRY
jgi:hypothetical protein